MKTSKDPRHLNRVKIIQELFAWGFSDKQEITQEKTKDIISNLSELDESIKKAAPLWPLEKINKMDLAVLRTAAYELLLDKKTPPKVVVDEAVEISKEYGSESSPSFVNGVLGKLIEDNNILT